MATHYAANQVLARSAPIEKIDMSDAGGKIRCLFDTFTLTADLAANDVIKFGQIPGGCRVIGGWLRHDDLDAAGGTIDLGWAASSDGVVTADDDGFIANTDVATAAAIVNLVTANLGGLGKKFDSAVDVQVKIEGDTDATTGSISVCIMYAFD